MVSESWLSTAQAMLGRSSVYWSLSPVDEIFTGLTLSRVMPAASGLPP